MLYPLQRGNTSLGPMSQRAANKKTLMDAKKHNERFMNWLRDRTDKELELKLMITEFEDKYFDDMTMKRFSKIIAAIETQRGKLSPRRDDPLLRLNLKNWIVKVVNEINPPLLIGKCIEDESTIQVKKGLSPSEEKYILLHEMIHVYEYISPWWCKEYVLLYLYTTLSSPKKIGERKLREMIDLHIYTDYFVGHGILFLLKSLDLDIRLKAPLGTVMGYERKELFEG